MGIVVIGAVFVDIKGFPTDKYIPQGRNVGWIEQVHGGVSRNVAEDIANVELRPTYVSLVDDNGAGAEVVRKLKSHKVNVDYIRTVKNGMGTWLAVFDHTGDVVGSVSQRPDMTPLLDLLEEKGDEIFSNADSIVIEICLDKEIVKRPSSWPRNITSPSTPWWPICPSRFSAGISSRTAPASSATGRRPASCSPTTTPKRPSPRWRPSWRRRSVGPGSPA